MSLPLRVSLLIPTQITAEKVERQMRRVQDSICASGLEIKQVQVGPSHLSGEREGLRRFLIHSYPTGPSRSGLMGFLSLRRLCLFTQRHCGHKLVMAGRKREGFLLENTRCSISVGLQAYNERCSVFSGALASTGKSGKTHSYL